MLQHISELHSFSRIICQTFDKTIFVSTMITKYLKLNNYNFKQALHSLVSTIPMILYCLKISSLLPLCSISCLAQKAFVLAPIALAVWDEQSSRRLIRLSSLPKKGETCPSIPFLPSPSNMVPCIVGPQHRRTFVDPNLNSVQQTFTNVYNDSGTVLRDRDTVESKRHVLPVLVETILQLIMMIRANDLKNTNVFYFYFCCCCCFQSMFTCISSFSDMMFDIHLLLKTNGYHLAYFKRNKLEEVIA